MIVVHKATDSLKSNRKTRHLPSARDIVIEYFRAHRGIEVPIQTLKEHVAVKRPDLGKNAIYTMIHELKKKGLVLQTRASWYRVTSNIILPETALTHRPELLAQSIPIAEEMPITPGTLLVSEASEPTQAPSSLTQKPEMSTQLAERTGDSFIDGYLDELEAALSDAFKAFERIDAIAKRTHSTLVHFAAFKRSLDALGTPSPITEDRVTFPSQTTSAS